MPYLPPNEVKEVVMIHHPKYGEHKEGWVKANIDMSYTTVPFEQATMFESKLGCHAKAIRYAAKFMPVGTKVHMIRVEQIGEIEITEEIKYKYKD